MVIIGDCLSVLSNKVLESCRHRAKALPGQPLEERHCFAQLMHYAFDWPVEWYAEEETYTGDAVMSVESVAE